MCTRKFTNTACFSTLHRKTLIKMCHLLSRSQAVWCYCRWLDGKEVFIFRSLRKGYPLFWWQVRDLNPQSPPWRGGVLAVPLTCHSVNPKWNQLLQKGNGSLGAAHRPFAFFSQFSRRAMPPSVAENPQQTPRPFIYRRMGQDGKHTPFNLIDRTGVRNCGFGGDEGS